MLALLVSRHSTLICGVNQLTYFLEQFSDGFSLKSNLGVLNDQLDEVFGGSIRFGSGSGQAGACPVSS
jgi:hypothetical protein